MSVNCNHEERTSHENIQSSVYCITTCKVRPPVVSSVQCLKNSPSGERTSHVLCRNVRPDDTIITSVYHSVSHNI